MKFDNKSGNKEYKCLTKMGKPCLSQLLDRADGASELGVAFTAQALSIFLQFGG